jgi:hypothetical protein
MLSSGIDNRSNYNQFLDKLSNPETVSSFYGPSGRLNNQPTDRLDVDAYMGDGDFGGQQLFADVIQRQTDDYMKRFAPLENALASSITATGTTYLQDDLQRTREGITGGITNAEAQLDRNQARYGATQRTAEDLSQEKTSAMVGGLNDTRVRDSDRRMEILGGGLSPLGNKAREPIGGNGGGVGQG